jgi:hypothetical protein
MFFSSKWYRGLKILENVVGGKMKMVVGRIVVGGVNIG